MVKLLLLLVGVVLMIHIHNSININNNIYYNIINVIKYVFN